jgi:prevent-host-death family protein
VRTHLPMPSSPSPHNRRPLSGGLDPCSEKRHNGVMRIVRIAELRNHLSRYLDYVRAGGRILVMDRNRPVAEIVPLGTSREDPHAISAGRLAALEREGVIHQGTGRIPSELLRGKAPGEGAEVLAALLEEREAGR